MQAETGSGIIKIAGLKNKKTETVVHQKQTITYPRFIMLQNSPDLPAVVTQTHREKQVGLFIMGGFAAGYINETLKKEDYSFASVKRADSLGDAFPVVLRSSTKNAEKAFMSGFITADLHGTGSHDLILWQEDHIRVYSQKKFLFSHQWPILSKDVDYTIEDASIVRSGGKDIVLCAVSRYAWNENIEDKKTLSLLESQPGNLCLIITDQGIQSLYLSKLEGDIISVSARSGKGLDSLAVMSRVNRDNGRYEVHVTHFSMEGNPAGPSRILLHDFYEQPVIRNIPGTDDMLAFSVNLSLNNHFWPAFIIPGKSAKGRFNDLTRKSNIFYGFVAHNNAVYTITADNKNLYAIDNKGDYCTWNNNTIRHQSRKMALCSIPVQKSDYATIIVPINKDNRSPGVYCDMGKSRYLFSEAADIKQARFLVIQSRQAGYKKLSEKELVRAGERFLSAECFAECGEEREHGKMNLDWRPDIRSQIHDYCTKKKIAVPELKTLEDIRKKLPGFYRKMKKEAYKDYLFKIQSHLFDPFNQVHSGGAYYKDEYCFQWSEIDSSGNYQRKDEYKKWLKSIYIPAEIIFSVIDAKGTVLSHTSLEGYVLLKSDTGYSKFNDYNLCYVSMRTRELSNTIQDEGVYMVYWK